MIYSIQLYKYVFIHIFGILYGNYSFLLLFTLFLPSRFRFISILPIAIAILFSGFGHHIGHLSAGYTHFIGTHRVLAQVGAK